MNEKVRSYLISVARKKDQMVAYSDLVRDCGLEYNLQTESGRHQLSVTLGDVSAYENQQGRPLLSALAIYKDIQKNDHGDGFYRIAEQLGKGKFKKLKDDLYGFSEAERCRKYWQDETSYRLFYNTPANAALAAGAQIKETDFFTKADLDFFKDWQYKPYDPASIEHVNAKDILMKTVWAKSIHLGKLILEEIKGFSLDGRKYWSQRGWKEEDGLNIPAAIFKPYTWIKLFRDTDKEKDVFFTFGVDAWPQTEAFIFKIDCQDKRDSKLSAAQIALCKSLIPPDAVWNPIPFEYLLNLDWRSLTKICVDFINTHIAQYDAIVASVWGAPIPSGLFKDTLARREKPEGGFDEPPTTASDFHGIDVDFHSKAKEQKEIGNAGELLVRANEIKYLTDKFRLDLAGRVSIVKDGEGYDVHSFDEFGNDRFIEVKTTTGNGFAPFYLSDNEIAFLRLHTDSYYIYRVYNYDADNNFGEYFEISGSVEAQLVMKPVSFMVFLKRR